MKPRTHDLLKIVLGILLAVGGVVLLREYRQAQGVLAVLPFVALGVGCGLFGHGTGNWIREKALQGSPELQQEMAILQKDERNVAIANRAKGKAFDWMLYLFGTLMVIFALMQVDLAVILLLVLAYLTVVGVHIYYLSRFEKEM